MEFNKLLVKTELDDFSSSVTEFAVDLACQLKLKEVDLLNIIIPTHSQAFIATEDVFHANSDMSIQMNQVLLEKHKQLIRAEARKYEHHPVKIKTTVTFNESRSDLNKFMKEFGAELLVAGSHDEHTFLDKLFSSGTEKMVRKIDYPMIVINKDIKINPIIDILVAIDIEQDNHDDLQPVVNFARQLDAKLHLLNVIVDKHPTEQEALEKLQQLAREYNLGDPAFNVVYNQNVESGIQKFSNSLNPDMLAVLPHGKGKIKELFSGSSSQEIIRKSKVPVFLNKLH